MMADWASYFDGCFGPCRLAGLAFMFSVGILMQILKYRKIKNLIASKRILWLLMFKYHNGVCRRKSVVALGAVQFMGCALYNNWWPMLSALMYIMVPMPCLFFGGGSTSDFITMSGEGDWMDAAKFLTGFSAVGSVAIPAILYHAQLIKLGAMLLELFSFLILLGTVLLFQKVSQEDDWSV